MSSEDIVWGNYQQQRESIFNFQNENENRVKKSLKNDSS